MKVKAVCDYYFNAVNSLSKGKEHNWKQNALDGVCVVSYFTVVVPLGFGIVKGISTLYGRITEMKKLSATDQKVNKATGKGNGNNISSKKKPVKEADTLLEEIKKAEEFKKAAEKGESAGEVGLGKCYLDGKGVIVKDEEAAAQLFRKAADKGYAPGQILLGDCYRFGRGVAKEGKVAVEWYKKAADQGDADGQAHLGVCYLYGHGIAKDEMAAVELFRKAAAQDNYLGLRFLATCYFSGLGVEKDRSIGDEWLKKANMNPGSPLGKMS